MKMECFTSRDLKKKMYEVSLNCVNFAQVPHNINFREKKSKLKKDKKAESGAVDESASMKSRIARFRYFEDISGYSGVRFYLFEDSSSGIRAF